MPAFRFPLQPVLDERRAAEAAKLRLLDTAERALALERERLATLEADRRRRGALLSSESTPADVRHTFNELDVVNAAIAGRQAAVDVAAAAERTARAEYLAARRAHEQVATLRDRQHAAFVAQIDRRDASDDDEANARSRTIPP